MAKLIDKSIPRFLLVGVGNTLLSMVLMFVLEGLGYWPSTAIAYAAGAVMSFFLNRYFTFHSEEDFWRSAAKFAINVAVLWTLTTPFLQPWLAGKLQAVFVERWANNVSLGVCMGLYTVLNYFGQRFFAFSKTKKGPSSKEEE